MNKLFILSALFFIISCRLDFSSLENDQDEEIYRSYTKIISRVSSKSFEDSLIFEAEKIYPDRDSVLAAVDPNEHFSIPETAYWFYSTFDGVYLPYAITNDAITYYDNIIDSLNAGVYQCFITAEFEYTAKISFKEEYTFDEDDPLTLEPFPIVSFARVYVLHMSLKWSHYCGPLCGLWINHKRIVIFDEYGNLLNVFLDGKRPVAVS